MDTFTIGTLSPWWLRALVRSNPLVRRSDRIEALVLVLAVLLAVVAIPVAGAVGTSIHEERSRLYAEQAQTRHQVIAKAVGEGQVVPNHRSVAFAAEGTWTWAGIAHQGVVPWSDKAKIGDRQSIWIDDHGDYVGPPTSPSRATGEAVAVAFLILLGVAEFAAASVHLIRRRLDDRRSAQWDRDIRAFQDNDGPRRHTS
ncbi:hypothetical protein A5724_25015 [Mycobacterium sp. ACS1612]|uniref:Rv1733c family protein n=1 Tax=Mycobacterium sp. ACS1612 TaxID=1834117 RepID=UPI0007FBE5F3|nr:hypothetical protein [Mycobacterium sp. ACS1612]OBF29565.1 hypothetical protein A5724_25015 [Mycobacterium sp. ACS1612]